MAETIILIDSEDEETTNKEPKSAESDITTPKQNGKRPIDATVDTTDSTPAKLRRIQPQKIGEVDKTTRRDSEDTVSDVQHNDSTTTDISSTTNTQESKNDEPSTSTEKKEKRKNEHTKELEGFINACRKAENNSDMKKIIKTKLLKYYDLVHPDFAQSKHLRKMLEDTALAILRDPKTVYSKLQEVINELKSRKNCGPIVIVEEPVAETSSAADTPNKEVNGVKISQTGDEKKDSRLLKLNKALTKLKKAIEDLEEAEVNLDEDDDSAYMKKVRYEKRAVEIYNKICEITGESKHAHRIVKQPIKFKGTKYKEFNRRLSKKVNKENGFPSFYDVYRLLDFCNKEHNYRLFKEEIQHVAEQAFVEVGKLLKERRCNDLYESAEHFAGKNKDPAKEDPELKAKLEKNKEYYRKKTEEILQLYVTKQLNGEDGEDDIEPGEPSTSSAVTATDNPKPCENSTDDHPTENILSIIDIKAECDTKEDTKEVPVIDLAIAL